MRVVLYAEGSGEAAGRITLPPVPGEILGEEEIGAGHVLVRRCLARMRKIPEAATRFLGPLRFRGVPARGSTLRTRQALRQLLTFPEPSRRPDLVVVLVDSEGDNDAAVRNELEGFVADLPIEHHVGVCRPEFEAWLIADENCVARALALANLALTPDPETLGPSGAKSVWNQWLGQNLQLSGEERTDRAKAIRIEVAASCDLDVVARRCPSFATFLGGFGRGR